MPYLRTQKHFCFITPLKNWKYASIIVRSEQHISWWIIEQTNLRSVWCSFRRQSPHTPPHPADTKMKSGLMSPLKLAQCEGCDAKPQPLSCTEILQTVKDVEKSNYKIQLIAAAPGSGNDWCMLTLRELTGKSYR